MKDELWTENDFYTWSTWCTAKDQSRWLRPLLEFPRDQGILILSPAQVRAGDCR